MEQAHTSQAALISGIRVPDSALANEATEFISILPKRFLPALGPLFAALLIPGLLQAQNAVTGALTGVVQDSSRAIVPGANVKIVDTATNATINVITNDARRYSVPLLKPSKYQVSATATGLSTSPTIITVLVGQVPNLDLTLNPTGSNTTVEVNSQAARLTDTQSPPLITTLP
jgi:hypothetical protein